MQQTTAADQIFSIRSTLPLTRQNRLVCIGSFLADRIFGLRHCREIYNRLAHVDDPASFMRQVLSQLKIAPTYDPEDLGKIPRKGGCIVVGNHPYGAIEGIILADVLMSVRTDVKIMVNYLLHRIPQMRDLTIAVDPFERADSPTRNAAPIRNAIRWVKNGGLLLIFPAGEVSHFKLSQGEIADPPWNPTAARIARITKAPVVPIFFRGQNSMLFQAAGLVHPRLRTILLAKELFGLKDKDVGFKIGSPINQRRLQQFNSDNELTSYLRWRTYIMGQPNHRTWRKSHRTAAPIVNKRQRTIAAAQDARLLAQDVGALQEDQLLVESGPFSVWCAQAQQIPHVLKEIGRLREISFRQAGEGTGNPIDLDDFDAHYLHLLIWQSETKEIVGAYRLGRTDAVIADKGIHGLYTSTLFQSRMEFYNKLGPALELGRSFIRLEYQKSFSALLLLWKGIGAYIVRHPHYRMLFGPVSISSDFSDFSRRLIATTLLRHNQAEELANMVRAKKPLPLKPIRIRGCARAQETIFLDDFKEVCSVVSDIEIRQKEVPVLLRQYLNLGGRLLCFNVDCSFSSVVDGLIVVDLLETEAKTLERYMGQVGYASFIDYHQQTTTAAACVRAR